MPSPKFADILFGPYEPDWGGMPRAENAGYLVDALGVRSTPNGYRGMPTWDTVANATTAGTDITIAFAGHLSNGTNNCFFALNTSGEIWESRAEGTDTWQNVAPASGTLITHATDLIQFGGDAILITPVRAPVSKDLSASHATVFANLAGSPPTAVCGAVIGQHVVLGGLSTDVYAVRTSAIGNHEDWPTPGTADARSKQAILESLNQELGRVVAILGGEKFGIVVQERGLTRMTYVGGSNVFEFDVYERQYGLNKTTVFRPRPVTDGKFWYWYNDHGFFVTDGYSVRNLAEGKIDEALFTSTISHGDIIPSSSVFTSAFDHSRSCALFSTQAGAGSDHQLSYNTGDGGFSFVVDTVNFIFNGRASATSSKNFVYNINSASRTLQKFTGATTTIAIQTGYVELEPGQRCQIHGAHLLGANIPSTLALSYKAVQNYDDCDVSPGGFSNFGTPAARGFIAPGRADAPFFSFRVTGTGSESHLYRGIRVYYTVSGPNQ